MLFFLSILSGILIAVMIAQNGALSSQYSNYHATVLVHAVGLASILLWMLLRHEKPHWNKHTKPHYYFGGLLGVLTVLFNNLCYTALGVSLTLALGLLGQCVAGGIVDHFGLFGLSKLPFQKGHILSFFFIIAGIIVMLNF